LPRPLPRPLRRLIALSDLGIEFGL
jgi:hypothetical protein